jgi:hypothetical protein
MLKQVREENQMVLYLLQFLLVALFMTVLTFLSFGFFIVLRLIISRKLGKPDVFQLGEPDVFQFRML